MGEPRIDADDERGSRKKRGELRKLAALGNDRATRARCEARAPRGFAGIAPWQHDRRPFGCEMFDQGSPALLGPELVGPARGVHEDRVRRVRCVGALGSAQLEARWTCGHIAQRLAGELSAAIDQVLLRIDAIAMAIEECRRALTYARAVRPVHRPAREPRDQRTFDLLLQVDHGVVSLVLELAMKASQLEPGRA